MERQYHERQGFKWYCLFFVSFFVGILLYFVFIPLFNFIAVQSKPNQELVDALKEYVPSIPLAQASTDDSLLVSWDMNNLDPYLMSKKTIKNRPEYSGFDDLQKATFISAVNPLYFLPYKVPETNTLFISGNNVHESPAMLAFLHATEQGQSVDNIQVISVGSMRARSDEIAKNVGVGDWVLKLDSLQGPSKRHSMDYMLNKVLTSVSGDHLVKFEYPVPLEVQNEVKDMNNRVSTIEYYTKMMINENLDQIDDVMTKLVKERFASQC